MYLCNMIKRLLANNIKKNLFKGKVILLFGASQVGKTTLIEQFLKQQTTSFLHISGDEPDIREEFKQITSTQIKNYDEFLKYF